jgi:pimeloyl-ACP methyl ester carboxylesterase
MSDKQIDDHYKNRQTKPKLKYLSYKSYHIYYAVVGDSTKPLMIYIHGAPGAWYSSMRLLDDTVLQRNFRMIAVDRAGFGKSNSGLSVTSIDQHVRYLEQLVSEYNQPGKKIYLLGSSYGAPIAAAFAMHNPQLMEELYLISPILDPSTEKIFWFSYLAKIAFINMWLSTPWQVATDEKFAHRRELRKLKPYWKQITNKTYVIMGQKDWIADKSNLSFARLMLENADQPEFYLLPNVGHGIIWQRTDLLKNLLLKNKIEDKQFSFALLQKPIF